MAITRTEDWSFTSTSEPSGDIEIGSGSSRVVLVFILDEGGGTSQYRTVDSFTIGDQTFDFSGEEYLDASQDLMVKVFGWWEESIQAMDSTTIAYTDDQTSTKLSWGAATYNNVQQVTPAMNGESSMTIGTTTASLSVDTTSTSSDMLVGAAIDASNNRAPLTFDTLTRQVDYNASQMASAIADGAGGDSATAITNDQFADSSMAAIVVILKSFSISRETATRRGIGRGIARGIA